MKNKSKLKQNLLKYGKQGSKFAIKFVRKNPKVVYDVLKVAGPALIGAFTVLKAKKTDYVEVPNIIDLDIKEAEKILEDLGFVTHRVLLNPKSRYYNQRVDTVIKTVPKSSKLKEGCHIKLYYIDKEVLKKSEELHEEKTPLTEKILDKLNKKDK